MAIAEYLQLTKTFKLTVSGGANPSEIVTLESGTPYRHYLAWVRATAEPGLVIDLDVQPKFGGENDGGAVNVVNSAPTKVFQIPIEEIRPATRLGLNDSRNPDKVPPIKSELVISNGSATVPLTVYVWMIAAATPGGA